MSRWFSHKPIRTSALPRSFRPGVEALETRVVPTLLSGPLSVNNSDDPDSNPATAIAVNDNDESIAVVVWTQQNSDGNTDILASVGSPPSTIGGTFTVADTDADEDFADVAINEDGDFVVVWTSTDNNNSDVYYALFRSGQTTPAITGTVAATNLQEVDPHVAMDKEGRFVVVYAITNEPSLNSQNQTVLSKNVRAKLYDNSGNENAMIRVAVSSTVDEFDPRIDMNTAGKFAISYIQSGPNAPTTAQKLFAETFSIKSDSTGVKQTGTFKIFSASGNQQVISQDVAVDKKGNTLVVFNQQTSPGEQSFFGRRVNGGTLKGKFDIEVAAFDLGTAVRLIMNQDNKNFAVTYQNTTGDGPHAFVQEFNSNGTSQAIAGNPFELDSVDDVEVDTSNAAISIDANNNYFVAYMTESNADDIDAQFGILA